MTNKIIDEIFSKYKKSVNMSFSEFKSWSKSPLSKQASLSRAPINRNLRLLNTPKRKWTLREVRSAIRTISFIKRMKGINRGVVVGNGLSRRDIALKNWGFDIKKKKR